MSLAAAHCLGAPPDCDDRRSKPSGHNCATSLDLRLVASEAYRMPTDIKPPQENENNRPKIVALVFVALLVVGCIWLFNSLNAANDKLNCVASGRRDCDRAAQ
jgi:hypothetical protein